MVRLSQLAPFIFLLCFITACKNTDGVAPDVITSPVIDPNIAVTSLTATSFTLTWSAAIDDATVAGNLMYKAVYSTTDNLTDAVSAEANGTVALNWTANTLTTPVSSLTNSTTYYVAVLVKDADDHISLAHTSAITLCTGKRMFLATANNGNLGGKTGADGICNAQKPVGMGAVKAMISDNNGINTSTGLPSNGNGRQACYGNCRTSNLYVLDWVFSGGQRYCTSDYTKKVGDAGSAFPVLYANDANVLSATPVTLYSGFHIQFGNSTTNCSNWTTTAGNFVGGTTDGTFTSSQSGLITGATGFPSCATAASLVCVEQ